MKSAPIPLIAPALPAAYAGLPLATAFERGGVTQEIPVTGFDGGRLALAYGYTDLEAFCEDIPKQGTVLDVGAGASTLGQEVCAKRSDVRWTSLDPAFRDKITRRQLKQQAPANLKFVAGDVFELEKVTNGRRYDKVLAYRLIHHLRLAGPQVALEGLGQLVVAAKPEEGTISVGPVKRSMKDKNRPDFDSVTVPAPDSEAEIDTTARFLLSATTLSFSGRFLQALINDSSRRLPL